MVATCSLIAVTSRGSPRSSVTHSFLPEAASQIVLRSPSAANEALAPPLEDSSTNTEAFSLYVTATEKLFSKTTLHQKFRAFKKSHGPFLPAARLRSKNILPFSFSLSHPKNMCIDGICQRSSRYRYHQTISPAVFAASFY